MTTHNLREIKGYIQKVPYTLPLEIGSLVIVFNEVATVRFKSGEFVYINHDGLDLESVFHPHQFSMLQVCYQISPMRANYTEVIHSSDWDKILKGGYAWDKNTYIFDRFNGKIKLVGKYNPKV